MLPRKMLGFNMSAPLAIGTCPLVNIQKAIENGPVEIVSFPMKIAW
jgi:hypothetical protein